MTTAPSHPALAPRSAVLATRGMVASACPLAAAAGLRVLQEGGNAMDAALTAAAVTWVTLPMMCGPAGDAFLLVYEAKTGRVTGIGGSGVVGVRATPDRLRRAGDGSLMPLEGLLAAAVPGNVDAFAQAMQRFGTRGWGDVLAPAITYAEAGYPVQPRVAEWYAVERDKLARHPEAAGIYLRSGATPGAGAVVVQTDLAASLRKLARGGAESFYRGELAAAIAAETGPGGLFDADDLAAHRSDVYEALSVDYRGYQVHQTRPPSQGIIHLQALQVAAGFDLTVMGPSAAAHHVLIEAKKQAVDERNRRLGDPRVEGDPVQGMLSAEHIAALRAAIDPRRARPATGGYLAGDTTYLCTVDRDGNAVSLIHSLSLGFGCGHIIKGTGIFLNNRAGRGFVLADGHPNQIAPGKRPMHTLNCYLVTRAGGLVLVGGSPGGDGQPQWNLQTVVQMLDWGYDPQQAATAPRWTHSPSTDPHTLGRPEALLMESRFPAATVAGLRRRGHPVQVVGPWDGGGAVQVLQLDAERGVLCGGSDPRADGCAMGH